MTKLRICFIGNSHSASFKFGWDAISHAYPDISVSFYFGRAVYQEGFAPWIDDGALLIDGKDVRLRAGSSEGDHAKIDFEEYDVCISLGGLIWWGGIDRRLYSKQMADVSLMSFAKQSQGVKLLTLVRQISDIPFRIVHVPFIASRGGWLGKGRGTYLSEVAQINEMVLFDQNAKLLTQPAQTFGASLSSKLEYAVGFRAVKPQTDPNLSLAPVSDDLRHMNDAYGALFLTEIFSEYGIDPIGDQFSLPIPRGHLSGEEKYLLAHPNK